MSNFPLRETMNADMKTSPSPKSYYHFWLISLCDDNHKSILPVYPLFAIISLTICKKWIILTMVTYFQVISDIPFTLYISSDNWYNRYRILR